MNLNSLSHLRPSTINCAVHPEKLREFTCAAGFCHLFFKDLDFSADEFEKVRAFFEEVADYNSMRPKRDEQFMIKTLIRCPTSLLENCNDFDLAYLGLVLTAFAQGEYGKKAIRDFLQSLSLNGIKLFYWEIEKMLYDVVEYSTCLSKSRNTTTLGKICYDLPRIHLSSDFDKDFDLIASHSDYVYTALSLSKPKMEFFKWLNLRVIMINRLLKEGDSIFSICTERNEIARNKLKTLLIKTKDAQKLIHTK